MSSDLKLPLIVVFGGQTIHYQPIVMQGPNLRINKLIFWLMTVHSLAAVSVTVWTQTNPENKHWSSHITLKKACSKIEGGDTNVKDDIALTEMKDFSLPVLVFSENIHTWWSNGMKWRLRLDEFQTVLQGGGWWLLTTRQGYTSGGDTLRMII